MAEERSAKRKRVPTSDEREEEASGREAMETVHDRSAIVGTLQNPITRKDFVRVMLPHLSARKTDPEFRWRKVSPTLLLFPEADDTGMQYEIEGSVRTLLVRKDGTTFEEALLKCRGKALLLNFCTPALEVYPKDSEHCRLIYDMEAARASVVPDGTDAEVTAFLAARVQQAKPLKPYIGMDGSKVRSAMTYYRQALGRSDPWRLAFNDRSITVIAWKLTRTDVDMMLKMLGRNTYKGERLYREESFSPAGYEFGEGDWVVLDVDPATNSWRLDKDGNILIRTVNEVSFESTYNRINAC